MDWELEIKDSGYLPEKGKPTEETVCYKIGGTYYGSVYLLRRPGTAPRQDDTAHKIGNRQTAQ